MMTFIMYFMKIFMILLLKLKPSFPEEYVAAHLLLVLVGLLFVVALLLLVGLLLGLLLLLLGRVRLRDVRVHLHLLARRLLPVVAPGAILKSDKFGYPSSYFTK